MSHGHFSLDSPFPQCYIVYRKEVDMGSLHLRDFPKDLHREVKAEAARRGMTLTAYVASVLRKALGKKKRGGK